MNLRSLNLPLSIKTTKSNPVETFFIPTFKVAVSYDIAVGYFSSLWVRDAAEGIATFASRGGQSRWIISPELTQDDYQAIKGDADNGLNGEAVEELIDHSFDSLLVSLRDDTRNTIAWLVRDGVLRFRIGIPINDLSGIMHAKMGLFADHDGNMIGFSGSYNLTGAAASNWERIDIYADWKSEESAERAFGIKQEFESMWKEEDPNLAIYRPSDRTLDKIIMYTNRKPRPYQLPYSVKQIKIPDKYLTDGKLRDYQQLAINNWFKSNGRGIFCMATGSGKTVTALSAIARLTNHVLKNNGKLIIIVSVPYIHLADQWEDEAESFGYKVIKCFISKNTWVGRVQDELNRLSLETSGHIMLITVNATFSKEPFQKFLNSLSHTVVFIADEMHNLGSKNLLKLLPENATFRLGLSATPDRHHDEQGTKSLEFYFGKRIIEFSLEDAINNGFLSKYYYHPIKVSLTENEMLEYQDLSAKISQAYQRDSSHKSDGPSDRMKILLIKRARLLNKAENKLPALCSALDAYRSSSYNLIYCGDSIENDVKYTDKAVKEIGKTLQMHVAKFTSSEDKTERRLLLDRFSRGELQALVAIKCLDEGVDIPKTQNAFILASSTNPREHIQRRGRVLRRAPGKHFARIFDFIIVPDVDQLQLSDSKIFNNERRILKRELERVNEFAELAINSGEALESLRKIKSKLHLLDH